MVLPICRSLPAAQVQRRDLRKGLLMRFSLGLFDIGISFLFLFFSVNGYSDTGAEGNEKMRAKGRAGDKERLGGYIPLL